QCDFLGTRNQTRLGERGVSQSFLRSSRKSKGKSTVLSRRLAKRGTFLPREVCDLYPRCFPPRLCAEKIKVQPSLFFSHSKCFRAYRRTCKVCNLQSNFLVCGYIDKNLVISRDLIPSWIKKETFLFIT
ncbi:hypothetical protein BHE74_00027087, partial [Ensete ventricosum]